MNKLLIRCSALGKIMSEGKGTKITDKQSVELEKLLSKIKLTEKQAKRRDELIKKRDAKPELGQTAKSYLKTLYTEEKTGRKQYTQTKYTVKGIQVEKEAIKLANEKFNWGYFDIGKTRFNNDYITGEPDVCDFTLNLLADVKSSWDIWTFKDKLFLDEDNNDVYFWQMVGYCMLTGIKECQLCYCLVNTPEKQINDEIRRREWIEEDNNEMFFNEERVDGIKFEYTYNDLPKKMRVKRFIIRPTQEHFNKIKERVKLAREYYNNLNFKF